MQLCYELALPVRACMVTAESRKIQIECEIGKMELEEDDPFIEKFGEDISCYIEKPRIFFSVPDD